METVETPLDWSAAYHHCEIRRQHSWIIAFVLFDTGKANLVMRIHGYLQRYGYLNFGMINRLNPMHGELPPSGRDLCVMLWWTSVPRENALQGGGGGGRGQRAHGC